MAGSGIERKNLSGVVNTLALAGLAYVVFDGFSHGRFDVRLPLAGSLTALVLGMCLVLSLVRGWNAAPRFDAWRGSVAVLTAAFVSYVWVSASVLGTGFEYGFAKAFVLVVALLTFVDRREARDVVLGAVAAAGIVQAVLGIVQFATSGMPQGGLTGYLPNHVQYGLYLAAAALLTLPLVMNAKHRWQRVAGFALVALESAVVVASLARGVIVALALAAIITAFVVGRDRRRAAALTAGVAVGLLGIGALSGRFAQLARIPQALGDLKALDALTNTRLQFVLAAWNMFLARPLFGFGYGRYREVWFEYAPGEILNSWTVGVPFAAHSTYLQIAAELGIVGLVLYLALLVAALGSVLRLALTVHDSATRWVLAAILCALLMFVFHGALDNSGWHDRTFWVLLALAAGMRSCVSSRDERLGYTTAEKPQGLLG